MNHQNSLQNSIRRLERARQLHPSEHEVLRRARRYVASLPERREREAQALASLTGWNIDEVSKTMGSGNEPVEPAGVTRGVVLLREDVTSSLCSSNERMRDTLHTLERRLDHNNRHHDHVLGPNLRAWLGPPGTVEPATRGPDARNFQAVLLHAVRDAQHIAIWPRCARLP